ncbi:MAG: hypothetical protein WC499_04360 [Patescibacteria group bacterium]
MIVIAGLIGFGLGCWITTTAVVEIANNFIEIDYDLVNQAIWKYKNNIGGCFSNEILQNLTG